MKVSVVTVTWNAVESIEKTIQSVLGQSYPHLEYIVIDGGSTDGTLDIVNRYRSRINMLVSEPDRGIYDAMNKGIARATGQWVNLMNAGDAFYSSQTIEKVFASVPADAEIVYGNYRILYPGFAKIKKVPSRPDDLAKGMILNHQSIFIKTELAQAYPFDLNYRLAADFKQVFELYRKEKKFYYSDQIIADYTDGGLSATKKMEYIRQCRDVVEKAGLGNEVASHYQKQLIKTRLTEMFKSAVPSWVFEKLMAWKYSRKGGK